MMTSHVSDPHYHDAHMSERVSGDCPTWKMLQKIDRANGTHFLRNILNDVELSERHKKLIKQQTTSTEEVIQRQEDTD